MNHPKIKYYFRRDFVTTASTSGGGLTFAAQLPYGTQRFVSFSQEAFLLTVLDKKELDLDKMSKNLDTLLTTIIVNGVNQVDSIENGLYTIKDLTKISKANLNSQLLKIIDRELYSRIKINLCSFLISEI